MLHHTVRVTLMTCLMMAITSSTLLADCPTPSFVAVTKRVCPSCAVESTVDSRTPGATIFLDSTQIIVINERQVFHGGDVQPGSRATFRYIDVATGEARTHVTRPARSNGVIHHEPENLFFAGEPGTRWEVVASWLDECGAGFQERSIGFVEMF